MGQSARTLWLLFPPLHVLLGVVHGMLVVLTLQTIHPVRHLKWVSATAKKMVSVKA